MGYKLTESAIEKLKKRHSQATQLTKSIVNLHALNTMCR